LFPFFLLWRDGKKVFEVTKKNNNFDKLGIWKEME